MTEEISYSSLVAELRQSFCNGIIYSCDARAHQLAQLLAMLNEHEEEIYLALYEDMHKCKPESNMTELAPVREDLQNAIKKLRKWMKHETVPADLVNKINNCQLRWEPLGVVLIVASWISPVALTLQPLISAIAAGNCVVLRLPNVCQNIFKLLQQLLMRYVSPDVVQIVCDDKDLELSPLLCERFNLIFHAGSSSDARILSRVAADSLTPVVLQVIGKCPVIIDDSCDLVEVAKRIVWGKFLNSGQFFYGPDYVICLGDHGKLIDALKVAITDFYGEDAQKSEHFGRIANKEQFSRIHKLINENNVAFGNVIDEEELYISPTIVTDVSVTDPIMQDAICGPVLPVVSMDHLQDAIKFINEQQSSKPEVIYFFSTNRHSVDKVNAECICDRLCVNDTFVDVASLPLLKDLGFSFIRGKSGLCTFSNCKGYLYKNQGLESVNGIRYPPYKEDWKLLKATKWALTPKFARK